MTCLNPIRLPQGIFVPCGKCISCRVNRQEEWIFRLEKEMLRAIGSSYAITLTYSDDYVPWDQETGLVLDKEDLQLFTKRLSNYASRKKMPRDYNGTRIIFENENQYKYYAVGEYGEKRQRPHFHIIVLNYPVIDHNQFGDIVDFAWTDENRKSKGFTYVDKLTTKAIRYVVGYIVENKKKEFQAFSMISKNIGKVYLTLDNQRYHRQNVNQYAKKINGTHIKLPRYYRDKFFTRLDKEKIYKKGLDFFTKKSDKDFLQAKQSEKNNAESKKRLLNINKKFKKL